MSESKGLTKAARKKIDGLVSEYQRQRWGLIPLIHEIQRTVGYVPPETIPGIAGALGLFPSQVQGVVTFYTHFHTEPQGKNVVRVCRGTACHVRGGKTVLKLVKRHLGVAEGETTPDFNYSLETVACIGCCALAPNIVVNDRIYGNMNPKKITTILEQYEEQQNASAGN
jgi:NADH:ubiquinone oxidoreductase subunit E